MPVSKYDAYKPKTDPAKAPLNFVAPTLENVVEAYDAIYDSGDFIGFNIGGKIPDDSYTGGKTHFQGIQRLQNSRYLVISGGDDKLNCGNLFVVKMESRDSESAWRSNLTLKDQLPAGGALDRIVLTLNINDDAHKVDSKYWHVGGISITGDVLAAPAESPEGGSEILFYNFQIPEKPTLLAGKFRIKRPDAKTGAVAITDLPGGHTLVGALGKHDDQKHYLDFYLTKKPNWGDGFIKIDSYEVDNNLPNCQNINFVKSSTGELYLIATESSVLSPVFNNDDEVSLYEIIFRDKTLQEVTPTDSIVNQIMQLKAPRKFKNIVFGPGGRKFSRYQSNMSAAAGVYIHPQGALFIYSSYHWRCPKDKNRVRMAEFRPDPALFTPDVIQSGHDCWLDMFVDENFKNIRLSLNGMNDITIANLRDTAAQGHLFGKRLSSFRCQLPSDKKLVLYARKNFETRDGFKEFIGDGKVINLSNLNDHDFGDKTLSCRVIPKDQPA